MFANESVERFVRSDSTAERFVEYRPATSGRYDRESLADCFGRASAAVARNSVDSIDETVVELNGSR